MEHRFTEEQTMIRDMARTIADERVRPVRQKYDEESVFPWDVVEQPLHPSSLAACAGCGAALAAQVCVGWR